MNGQVLGWVVLAVVLVGVAVAVALLVRRHRYVTSLRERGWSFESAPRLEWVLDHHAPPFGLGLERAVDEGIAGTTAGGVPFRVFEYAVKGGGPRFDARLASLRLPLTLPDLFVSAGPVRPGVRLPALPLEPALQVHAADPGYARALLSPGGAGRAGGVRPGRAPGRPQHRRGPAGRRRRAEGPRPARRPTWRRWPPSCWPSTPAALAVRGPAARRPASRFYGRP